MSAARSSVSGAEATPGAEGFSHAPQISVVVPAFNASETLPRCLDGVAASLGVIWEGIVVDDGSTDGSGKIARERGFRVTRVEDGPRGPAHARNVGVNAAQAPLVCFVDADVVCTPTTLAELLALFSQDAGLAAAFGSYDAAPDAPALLSQYRNLLHHYVHQNSSSEAFTFWAGCGAIRRDVFLELGGFDEGYDRPSVEDIELGYRLAGLGERVRLAREIQVKHLKRWTFVGILVTDIRDRALPWTALIRRSGKIPGDLNLSWASRLSALSLYSALGLLLVGARMRRALLLVPLSLAALVWLNRTLYALFARRGPRALAVSVAMHWLYYAYSTLAFAAGTVWEILRRVARRR